jgi:hypothetical protein
MLMLLLTIFTAQAATVRASSTHRDADGSYTAAQAFDGSFRTGWAESKPGSTEGEWIEIDLGQSTQIDNIAVWPGNLKKGSRSFREYSRPRTIQVVIDGKPHGNAVILEDKMHRKVITIGARGRKVRIAIQDAYEGIVFTDTHIAEVSVNFPNGPLSRYDNWLKTADAKRRHKQFSDQLDAAYIKQKDTEFGDKDAFAFLLDSVAEGPPYARDRVSSLVPLGYRAQAAPASAKAMKALRLLKDANAIPAFEMAALRATGDLESEAQQTAELLRAHQDMIGQQHSNVPFWGDTGWNLGALQGFGEPLAMDMDKDGNIFVADTGNNRIQRFALNGRAEKQWGPGAELADAWFEAGRPWYASGARPGTKVGEFTNPVDVAVIPTKEGDGFAALDAQGRVQVFDAKGRPVVSWNLSTAKNPRSGLGGDGYLLYLPKRNALLAVMQNEARLHGLDSEELAAWKITDGAPRAAEADPKGNVLFSYGNQIIKYHPEGFRYGTVITKDQLGEGHEDLDMALDEKNKLWVLTDNGTIIKFKRPGVVDFSVRAIDRPLTHPRIVVREGMVFFLSDDRIEQVDALQARMDAETQPEG